MKILLANYNYYPDHSGGSEVYVSGLVGFLRKGGHEVRIVAAIPVGTMADKLDFSGSAVRISIYNYDDFPVAGVWLENETTDQIYGKYDPVQVTDWKTFFHKNPDWIPDFIHLHGYTGTINTALVEGLRSISPGLPFYFSYHTPVSCPKGTLYRFNREECSIKPNPVDCTSCQIHNLTQLPVFAAKLAGILLPLLSWNKLPAIFRMKHLVSLELQSFERIKLLAGHWFVFSEYIRNILLINKINPEIITMIRHGIDPRFIDFPASGIRPDKPVTFVFMGRMEKIKGILTLVSSWEKLVIRENRRLLLLGTIRPDTDSEIKTGISRLSSRQDVSLEKSESREDLISKLDHSHVLIIPSEWIEIGPLVFHEGIARGMNIIASDMGGTKELSGFYKTGCTLFKAGDPESLKKSIENFSFQEINREVQSETAHYKMVTSHYPEASSR
ncbi:MAG: glycosyltransferase [Bacteroidetes bacterium]|nr:glycosyltransferase [Bacteroidota bacterium]